MPMSVTYTNFCGMVIHENRGGVERDYMPDPLGSTAALLDNTQTKTDTWEYWPYGEVSARTGTNPTPLTYIGTQGYFKDILDAVFYVRARFLKPNLGRWLTVDPLWPSGHAYGYARNNPTTYIDPSGESPLLGLGQGSLTIAATPCDACASAILRNWWHHPAHFGNHQYAHCMACCVLTKLAGPDCAISEQRKQNAIDVWPIKGLGRRHEERVKLCSWGIAFGLMEGWPPYSSFGECNKRCLDQFPMKPPTIPPFPPIPECDPMPHVIPVCREKR